MYQNSTRVKNTIPQGYMTVKDVARKLGAHHTNIANRLVELVTKYGPHFSAFAQKLSIEGTGQKVWAIKSTFAEAARAQLRNTNGKVRAAMFKAADQLCTETAAEKMVGDLATEIAKEINPPMATATALPEGPAQLAVQPRIGNIVTICSAIRFKDGTIVAVDSASAEEFVTNINKIRDTMADLKENYGLQTIQIPPQGE